jgi:hypothetical protein
LIKSRAAGATNAGCRTSRDVSRETDEGDGRGDTVGDDEQLEIVFWWMGRDPDCPDRSIEDDLDEHLTDVAPARRRRRPWPGRRTSRAAEPLSHPA